MTLASSYFSIRDTGGYIDQLAFMSSESWSPARPCRAIVTVLGAGGSGAAGCINGGTSNGYVCVTGGGAGGMSQSRLELDPSTTYTIVVGTGGADVSAGTATGSSAGNAGGSSSFSGTGITTMTANGGAGGNDSTVSSGGVAQTATGALGGTATGGNILNASGGDGGESYCINSTAGCGVASGGGGAPLRGVGYAGGRASNNAGTATRAAGSGGGGVGGKGGDAYQFNFTLTLSYGGGECGPALDENSNAGTPTFSRESGIQPGVGSSSDVGIQVAGNMIGNWAFGSIAQLNGLTSHWTRGSGGNANNGTSTNTTIFGGGGAAAKETATNLTGGTAQICGGGGGASSMGGVATSGRGGHGMVLIQIEEYLD
jgi:hypothetical protein